MRGVLLFCAVGLKHNRNMSGKPWAPLGVWGGGWGGGGGCEGVGGWGGGGVVVGGRGREMVGLCGGVGWVGVGWGWWWGGVGCGVVGWGGVGGYSNAIKWHVEYSNAIRCHY